jgi:hypothetical protein
VTGTAEEADGSPVPDTQEGTAATPAPQADGSVAGSTKRVLAVAGKILAPVTLITAVLYYFGWVRTNSVARALGLDPSLMAFSTTDYMLRSIDAVYTPIGVALFVAIALLLARMFIEPWLIRRNIPKVLPGILIGGGALMIFFSGWRLRYVHTEYPAMLSPLLLVAGGVALLYGFHLASKLASDSADADTPETNNGSGSSRYSEATLIGLIVAAIITGLFAATLRYADDAGTANARRLLETANQRAKVTVIADKPLLLERFNIEPEILTGEDGNQLYAYDDLRFLVRANNRTFLFALRDRPQATPSSTGIVPTQISVVVVPDDSGVLLVFDNSRSLNMFRRVPVTTDTGTGG